MIRLCLLLIGLVLSACSPSSNPAPGGQTSSPSSPADPEIAQLYNRSCRSCHAGGTAGAPRSGDAAAWQPRVDKGLDTLLDHTINGYQGMPPMGMCMDCNAEQFIALIEFMAGQELE